MKKKTVGLAIWKLPDNHCPFGPCVSFSFLSESTHRCEWLRASEQRSHCVCFFLCLYTSVYMCVCVCYLAGCRLSPVDRVTLGANCLSLRAQGWATLIVVVAWNQMVSSLPLCLFMSLSSGPFWFICVSLLQSWIELLDLLKKKKEVKSGLKKKGNVHVYVLPL